MRKHWLFVLHKYLALLFSLPLFLIALSGVLIAIAPLFSSGSASSLKPTTLHALMVQVGNERPTAQLMRGLARGPGGATAHLMVNEDGKRQFIWSADGALKSHDLSTDFFYQNKHFHEGFLLSGPGKKIVAFSGLALALIVISGMLFWMGKGFVKRTQNIWTRSPRRLAAWHVVLGMVIGLPLLFQAITGSLIELHSWVFADNAVIEHEVPTGCTVAEQQALVAKLESDPQTLPGQVFFCRPGFPYLMVRHSLGQVVQYTPAGLAVMTQDKEHWDGTPLTRKGFFVGLHEGKIFGKAHHIYNFVVGISLAFFIISGLVLWSRKKLNRARKVQEEI